MIRRVLVAFGIFIVLAFVLLYEILWAPNTFDEDRFVIVSKGESFRQVLDSLDQAGVVRSRLFFDLAGRIHGYTKTMQIGKYRFKPGMSNREILKDLHEGITIEQITISLPEGLRTTRQARIFARTLGVDSARFMRLVEDSTLTRTLGVHNTSLSGYLMPNTYQFYWQTDEEDILREMVKQFWKVFNDTLQQVARSRGLSVNDVVTMASIIELETAIDSERAVIAGVYYNRLAKRMRLQADPTVQYILHDGPRRLRYSDLQRESAYNTYLHYGLPPGPINNPGKASILAALFPIKHKYLFFVANGQGGHNFSSTYTQHLKQIQHFRKIREEQQAARDQG